MSKWSDAAARYHAQEAAWLDVQPTVARCAFCPGWKVEGAAGEVRMAALEHRLTEHPETRSYRRPRRTRQLTTFVPVAMLDDEKDEIQSERVRRAFLNGVEIEL